MMRQWVNLCRILLDPRVTRTPRRVLAQLRARGIRRLPPSVERNVRRGVPALGLLPFLRDWLGSELLSRHGGQWVINSFTPPFPGPAFDRAFTNLLSGRRYSPVSAFLALTRECPYGCAHCSAAGRKAGALDTGQWLSAVEGLHRLGATIIGFTGGEPCSRTDLVQIVGRASRGAATILFTSGAGFTPVLSAALKARGLWSVCVSLDDSDPERYGRARGNPDAFRTAVEALRIARAGGFYTMANAVASPRFVDECEFERVLDVARRMGVHELRIVEPMPCGRLREAGEDEFLTSAQLDTLRMFHRRVNRRGRLPKVCAFNQIESPEFFGCAGGVQHMYIDTAGEVCPCDFTPMSFGNVTGEPLEIIWERMTGALGAPRSHCMVQTHRALFAEYAGQGVPSPPAVSMEICRRLPREKLPRYYAMVAQGRTGYGR